MVFANRQNEASLGFPVELDDMGMRDMPRESDRQMREIIDEAEQKLPLSYCQ
jgi:hypothetical protein